MTTTRTGFTLVEIMIAVVILAVLAALAMPSFNSGVAEQLDATAQVVSADLAQIRQLAVANNSQYRLTFETSENRFYWEHTGTNTALNVLPPTIYSNSANTPTRQYVDLDDLPQMGPGVFLSSVQVLSGGTPASVTTLEFGPLGATTQTADTLIWLSCGAGDSLRYLYVRVNAVTGLAQIGDLDAVGPVASGS